MSPWIRLATALLITAGLTACTSEERAAPPSPTNASSTPAESSQDPGETATPTPSNTSLRDPMLDLAQRDDEIGQNQPIVTERGTERGEFALPESGVAGDAVVAVTCTESGRFTVESNKKLVLSSPCANHAEATIRLAGDKFGKTVSVTAPGAFWLVIVPAA